MAFKVVCEFCSGDGNFEFERGSIFIVCEECGQEREVLLPHNDVNYSVKRTGK